MPSSISHGALLLAFLSFASLCLQVSEGTVSTPVGGAAAAALPLKGAQSVAKNEGPTKEIAEKLEAMEMSDVTRENSNSGDAVRAPKVTESRSLSDDSERAEEAAPAPQEPIKRKNIWHQLSGIVTGNKGASPSPARQEETPTEQEPIKRKNIWHQLSGIVIGGKPASPSPARAVSDAGASLREKSLSRGAPEPAAAPQHKTGHAPTVPPLRAEQQESAEEAHRSVQGEGNFTVNVYSVEDANMVRWAPMKLDDQVLVPVYFKPKPKHLKFTNLTRDVTLVGSWSNWQDHFKLQPKGGTECWDGVVNIPVGRHYFKFIVDDQWTIVGQWPVEIDDKGNVNNVIEIPEPSSGMLMQERKSVFAKKKKNMFGF